MNRNFGTLDENNKIVYAPNCISYGGCVIGNPTADDYHASGYKDISNSMPEKVGVYYTPTEFGDIVDDVIVRRYDEHPIVAPDPVPRRWTRMKLRIALATAGWLERVNEVLAAIEIAPGYTALAAFGDCDYIEEWFPTREQWDDTLNAAAEQLGVTREQVDEFLDNVPREA